MGTAKMAYCSKCGIKLEDSWLHCPACGQAVVSIENTNKSKPEKTSKKVEGAETFSPVELEDFYSNANEGNPATESKSRIRSFPGYLSATLIVLLCLVMISALSKESPESQDHQIVAGSTDSDIFLNEVKLFRNDGCKPETYTSDDGSKQMQVNFPDETIDLEPTKNYLNNKIDPNKWNSFGNQVDRALFIIRDYQSQLSYHYYLMFDLYRKYGMEKFVDQFNKYLETFKKDARLLCYTSSPSKQQFRLANKYTSKETVNNLDLEWQTEFNSWIDKVAAAQEKAAVLYDKAYWKNKTYEDTVYCEEKNTSLQDYKLVKCYP